MLKVFWLKQVMLTGWSYKIDMLVYGLIQIMVAFNSVGY
jgi:ABC-type uncharacterized transport system permease subunit